MPGIHKIIERAGAEFGYPVITHQGRGCGNQSKDILTGVFQEAGSATRVLPVPLTVMYLMFFEARLRPSPIRPAA